MKTGIKNELSATLNASPNKVWDLLKTGEAVDKWFPFIKTCKLEGEGVGAKRICSTEDGKTLEESILAIDHENMVFKYSIDNHTMDMPTENIQGTMQIKNQDGKTQLDWEVSFDLTMELDEATVNEMKGGMVMLMQTGADGLEALAG